MKIAWTLIPTFLTSMVLYAVDISPTLLKRHTSRVSTAASGENASTLVSLDVSGKLIVWDLSRCLTRME